MTEKRGSVNQVDEITRQPAGAGENLALFGGETYPKLEQQLQRRYPKHE